MILEVIDLIRSIGWMLKTASLLLVSHFKMLWRKQLHS